MRSALDVQFAAMSVALVASILFGMAYAIGRPARTRARGTEMSLNGGKGSMLAVVAGVLILGLVQNAMSLLNVDSFWQYVARGSILLGAIAYDRWRHRHAP